MHTEFLSTLKSSADSGTLIAITLASYKGAEEALKRIEARPVIIKQQPMLQLTYRYQTRDIAKNIPIAETADTVAAALSTGFAMATLYDVSFDLRYDASGKKPTLKRSKPSRTPPESQSHDRAKQRQIDARAPYLHALGITDVSGKVRASAQDKFRQIDKYVEIVGGLVAQQAAGSIRRIADMGAGKGYLTFALYDHLRRTQPDIAMLGVEARPDLVALGNRIAGECDMTGLRFEGGTIAEFDAAGTDLLIALHACDTATDDAIAKGISAGAQLIVVAPCCHKQIRRAMETAKHAAPELSFLTRHGTFLERQAEMVTDGLRALLLEQHGYRTKLFEFIADAHTPKNVMIVATRSGRADAKAAARVAETKAYFGISRHALEDALDR